MVNALTPKHLAEKRAGFHELFFDLIFVYAIQKIAHVILTTQTVPFQLIYFSNTSS